MIKLIACDLDGTILDSNKIIDSKLKEVKKKLEDKGINLTIVSGRNEEISKDFIDYLEVKTPYITNNGGNIYQNHKCILNNCIPREYNNTIARKLYENDIPFRLFAIEKFYGYANSEFFKERQGIFENLIHIYSSKYDISDLNIYKITADFVGRMDYALKFKEELLNACPNLTFVKADTTAYCANSLSATKGNALINLCELLNIDISEVMAFGDNGNDLSMLEKAGISVVMENGDPDVKKIADYICKDNNHNGVSDFLIDYFKL